MNATNNITSQALRLAATALADRTRDRRDATPNGRPVDDFDAGWFTGMSDAIKLLDQLADIDPNC